MQVRTRPAYDCNIPTVDAIKQENPNQYNIERHTRNVVASLITDANDPTARSVPDIELAGDFVKGHTCASDRPDLLQAWCDAAQLGAALRERVYRSSSSVLQGDLSLMSTRGFKRYLERTRLVDASTQGRILAASKITEMLELRLLLLYIMQVDNGRIRLSQAEKSGLYKHFGLSAVTAVRTSNNLAL
jgi:hypothetical protein